jgi:trans-2,3-dihydro-3-hydroxyanthranilate isomerase
MRHHYHTLDVFTDRLFGGNQLAVFPDARGLSGEQMALIARELNLSETVFVLPPETPAGTRRLRIFTPGMELPFAGHPTVGTAFLLAAIGEIPLGADGAHVVFEEGVGPVRVAIAAENGKPTFARLAVAKLPEIGPPPPSSVDIAALLSLDLKDVCDGEFGPQAVSCGVPFLFVPLRTLDAVRRARLDQPRWERRFARFWAPHVYIFARGGELPGSDVHARMFAPAMGIAEDPATGAAASALAGYLAARDRTVTGTLRWTVEQGFEMGRPSILYIEADKEDGAITGVRVGGRSVLVGGGWIDLPVEPAE